MSTLTRLQQQFVDAATTAYPNRTELTMKEVLAVCEATGLNLPQWLTNDRQHRVKRGVYRLPTAETKTTTKTVAAAVATAPKTVTAAVTEVKKTEVADAALAFMGGASLVPDRLPTYVPFGAHADLTKVIKSRRFYPVYITGLSGNGKTTTVEQACAENNREFFRVNITPETCEDDLIGGFRLLNGETKWVDGPVLVAMKRGGILLLDEIDLGTIKIMCLQPVLEGKRVFVKKTNTWVAPAEGFNVIATGNTKGRGDDTGKFVGTNCMNEAFLDRIGETVEQDYPPEAVEVKIVNANLKGLGVTGQETFATALVKWAQSIRKTFAEGEGDEVITTRRLVQAANAYSIYGDRLKAVEKVTTRFDAVTKAAFIDLYKKLDAEATAHAAAEVAEAERLAQAPTANQVTLPNTPTATAATTATATVAATPTVTATTNKAPF
jgi:MoxR-like ATPase